MKKFTLENIIRDHEPYKSETLDTKYLSDMIIERAHKLSQFGGMNVLHATLFEYNRRDDSVITRTSSWVASKNNKQILRMDYTIGDVNSNEVIEKIVSAIGILYINYATMIPCACDLYAFTNCSDKPNLICSVDHHKYKDLFKVVKILAKESDIYINNSRMKMIIYEDYSHKFFYIPPIPFQIIDNSTNVETITLS